MSQWLDLKKSLGVGEIGRDWKFLADFLSQIDQPLLEQFPEIMRVRKELLILENTGQRGDGRGERSCIKLLSLTFAPSFSRKISRLSIVNLSCFLLLTSDPPFIGREKSISRTRRVRFRNPIAASINFSSSREKLHESVAEARTK